MKDTQISIAGSTLTRAFRRNFTPLELQIFLIGLTLKVIFGTFLASNYLLGYFIPFVDYFVSNFGQNPYEYFLTIQRQDVFPYPAGMLYILAIPQSILHLLGIGAFPATLLAYRLVILLADCCIYFVLRTWLNTDSTMRLLWLYWLSPVAFYINYVHGQLDVIPIALLVVSLYMIFNRKIFLAAMFLGMALASKTSVALILPLYILFISRERLNNISLFILALIATFVVINLPFLLDPSFLKIVFMNEEQAKIFSLFIDISGTHYYLVLAGWLYILGLGLRVGMKNRNLFIMFIGFSFSVFLMFIPPMYGWYYWVIPFFAFFLCLEKDTMPWLFVGLQALYLLYFLLIPESDYAMVFQYFTEEVPQLGFAYNGLVERGYDAKLAQNFAFTLLQTSLLAICVLIYRRGIRRYRDKKFWGRPFLIGVGGNSGVGKTSLTDALEGILTQRNITVLRGDDRHKWARGDKNWEDYTHLNPQANHLHEETPDLRALRKGKKVLRRMYDHSTGKFTEAMRFTPKRLTVLEGLHPFFLAHQRSLFDLKVFIEPEEQLSVHWKICRDKKKRNYSSEQVLQQITKRKADAELFIESQKQFSDIVVTPRADRKIPEIGDDTFAFDVHFDLVVKNSLCIDPAIGFLRNLKGLEVTHRYKDVDYQLVSLKGDCSEGCTRDMSKYFAQKLQEIGVHQVNWPTGLFGAVSFILLYCVFEEAEHD